jgi:hypothetical protein
MDVFEALRGVAMRFGVPKLSQKIGTPLGVLYNKCNPHSERNIFTLQDLISICAITGETSPLQALSHQLGGVFYPLPDMKDKGDAALLDIINSVHVAGGNTHHELALALEDGQITDEEFARIDEAIQYWMAALLELRHRGKSMVVTLKEEPQP